MAALVLFQQLGSGSASAAAGSRAAPADTATEIVTRPDPGLARGKWEAPAWVFWTILALVIVSAAAYVLHRAGVFTFKKKSSTDAPPPSSKMRGR